MFRIGGVALRGLRSRVHGRRMLAAAPSTMVHAMQYEATRCPGEALMEQINEWSASERDLPCKQRLREAYFESESSVNASNVRMARQWLNKKHEAEVVADTVTLVDACRSPAAKRRASPLQKLLQEYSLSSKEGVTLMGLAEALLRVRSAEGRSRLIQDKLDSACEWMRVSLGKPAIVNAASSALAAGEMVVGSGPAMEAVAGSLGSLVHRVGENAVRVAVVAIMRNLGDEFVLGEKIETALQRAERDASAAAYGKLLFSYDMLGEAAKTAQDADDYFEAYADAIDAIGKRGFPQGSSPPGISIKLSALDPAFEPARGRELVLQDSQLVGRVAELATRASDYGLDFTIDAEEATRLELQLDVLARVSRELKDCRPDWEGLGLAVQAYQRRAPAAIDYVAEIARRDQRKQLRVRLVKGAYWDTEIKRAQSMGLSSFPVYTRKEATDVCYTAVAGKLLTDHSDCLRPAFATHNARTVATVAHIAKTTGNYQFELQRLHGMGEDLHAKALSTFFATKDVATRVYAPVGNHDKLLAYLVRRLLENGANSSFVNALADDAIPAVSLAVDPTTVLEKHFSCSAHPNIQHPSLLFPNRPNSEGHELAADFNDLRAFAAAAQAPPTVTLDPFSSFFAVVEDPTTGAAVGVARRSVQEDVDDALSAAVRAQPSWDRLGPKARADILRAGADAYEAQQEALCWLLVAEAGKTWLDAIGEVREAVDFLRYYADQAESRLATELLPGPVGERNELSYRGRGVFAAVSPWNFPLAIFTGQIAAPLAAGNTVVAKSAPQTPLIAAAAVDALRSAGMPGDVLMHLSDPDNSVGELLIRDSRVCGVVFTGSSDTAVAINRALASRPPPIPSLVAETAGLNALIADETALPEQLVTDVVRSAFASSGQRCSNARLLCVPTQTAPDVLQMLAGAVELLRVGDPADLSVDCGPLIDPDAKAKVVNHLENLLRVEGTKVLARASPAQSNLPDTCFFSPTVVQIPSLEALPTKECFGPILHVLEYDARADGALAELIEQVNELGYGLTMGIHSRLDQARHIAAKHAAVGNLYINRDTIAATVEAQPFGGSRLSGTGPKAGGPNYVRRFAVEHTVTTNTAASGGDIDLMASI